MSIFGSCRHESGKYPGKPLMPLLNCPISVFHKTFKPRSYPSSIYEGITVVIFSAMNFCNFKSCPLDTTRNPIQWFISKPYLFSEISNGIHIYIEGTTPKVELLQFLLMGSRTNQHSAVVVIATAIVNSMLHAFETIRIC